MPDLAPRADEPVARVIRVFISSTFRDMVEEREQLAKRVFPALRKLCEPRGVVWGEVEGSISPGRSASASWVIPNDFPDPGGPNTAIDKGRLGRG